MQWISFYKASKILLIVSRLYFFVIFERIAFNIVCFAKWHVPICNCEDNCYYEFEKRDKVIVFDDKQDDAITTVVLENTIDVNAMICVLRILKDANAIKKATVTMTKQLKQYVSFIANEFPLPLSEDNQL